MARPAGPQDRDRASQAAGTGGRLGFGPEQPREPASPAIRPDPTPLRAVLVLILAATLVRLAFAGLTGLGIDESYMVAAGRVSALGYFDHPPLSWWLSRGAAVLAGSEAPVVVRAPFVVLAALTTFLVYRLGAVLFSPWAGFWGALALTLAPLFGVTSGTWVLPDGPLDAAVAGFALAAAHAVFGEGRRATAWWLAAGVAGGLAMLSKYTTVLTFAGLALFLLTRADMRRWFVRPGPWLAAAVALLLFTPVIVWNADNGWASFGFQGGRGAVAAFRPEMALLVLAGGALFVSPWIFAGQAIAAWGALRAGPGGARRWFLACLGLVPVAFFAVVAVWSPGRPLFHWAAPGYLVLMPLLGDLLARATARGARWPRIAAVAAAVFTVAGLALVTAELRFQAVSRFVPSLAAATLQGRDWTALAPAIAATGVLDRPGGFVGTVEWHVAGKVGYALGEGAPVVCLCRDARQFGLIRPWQDYLGGDAVLVAPPGSRDGRERFGPWFEHLEPAGTVEIGGAEVALWIGRGLRRPQD